MTLLNISEDLVALFDFLEQRGLKNASSIGVLTLALAAVPCCARAEACLDSARAVWAQNPKAHATWNLVDGKQCWRAGWPRTSPSRHARPAYGMASATSRGSLPLPRPRPDAELLHRDRYQRLTRQQGRALADDLFGSNDLREFQ